MTTSAPASMAPTSVMAAASTDPQLLQARLAHLAAMQTIIARLAGYSATVKNFSLTVAAGLIGLAWGKPGTALLMVAAFGFALTFMCLDAYYLALERSFRDAHTEVCGRDIDKALDQRIAADPLRWGSFLRAIGSISVWLFYLPLFVVLGLLTFYHAHA